MLLMRRCVILISVSLLMLALLEEQALSQLSQDTPAERLLSLNKKSPPHQILVAPEQPESKDSDAHSVSSALENRSVLEVKPEPKQGEKASDHLSETLLSPKETSSSVNKSAVHQILETPNYPPNLNHDSLALEKHSILRFKSDLSLWQNQLKELKTVPAQDLKSQKITESDPIPNQPPSGLGQQEFESSSEDLFLSPEPNEPSQDTPAERLLSLNQESTPQQIPVPPEQPESKDSDAHSVSSALENRSVLEVKPEPKQGEKASDHLSETLLSPKETSSSVNKSAVHQILETPNYPPNLNHDSLALEKHSILRFKPDLSLWQNQLKELKTVPAQDLKSQKITESDPIPDQPPSGLGQQEFESSPEDLFLSPEPNEIDTKPDSTTSTIDSLLRFTPDTDLLRIPSKPAETDSANSKEPITLQQAIKLGQRNNLDLRVVELQLQQSRAGLKQAKAAKFPILSFQGDISREDSSIFDLTARPLNVDVGAQNEVIGRTLQILQSQQALSLQALQQDIVDLQLRLQQGPDQQQQLIFDQQIQALQLRANTTATPPLTSTFAPFSPITSFASSGQGSTFGGVSNTLNGVLALTYNVFTSGSRSSAIRSARAQLRLAELTLEAQREQLRLDVTNDYYNLQEAMALIEVAQSTVDNATKSTEDSTALERAGLGTFFDVLQAEIRLANAQQDLTQAKTIERIAQRQLVQRLNVPEVVNLAAADPVEAAGQWPLSLPKSVRLALQNRPELSQLLQQRRLAKEQKRFSLATVRPQVQAFANLTAQEELDDDFSGTFGYSVGAQVTWNFFDGGAAKAQAAQEEENIAIAETQFADTKNTLRFQVEQAYSNLQSNRKNIEASSKTVNQAQESLRLARLRFQAGIGTQLEITTAETDLTQAQGNLLSAILDYNRALALIQRATSYKQDIVSLAQ